MVRGLDDVRFDLVLVKLTLAASGLGDYGGEAVTRCPLECDVRAADHGPRASIGSDDYDPLTVR